MTQDPRGNWTSASHAAADLACPGRFLAQAGLPEIEGDDKARSIGDRVHAALAGEIKVPTLQSEELEIFDACRSLEKKLVLQYFGEGKETKVFRHQRKWAKFQSPDLERWLEHSGEFDVMYRVGTKALIIDYKTGRNEVEESPRNLQLRDLAVLVHGNEMLLQEIATAVIQPLVSTEPSICVYDQAALKRAEFEMFTRVNKSHHEEAPRTAGEMQCGFCRAKRLCMTYQKWAAQLAPPALLGILEVPMASWSPEQRTAAANALKPCEDFLNELKKFLKEGLAFDDQFVPGWTLRNGNVIETITNPQECFDRASKLGVMLPEFMTCVSVGKTRLRDLLSVTTGAKGKALDEAMKAITEGISSSKQNAPSLVRAKETK